MAFPFDRKLFSAPMAEITTPALRRVIRKFSKDTVLYSEMLSAGALVSGASHNEPLLMKLPEDDPISYQIVGSDPSVMAEACTRLSERGCWSVDINMGCPVSDIVKKRQGARLLTEPERAREIVRACRKVCTTRLSVKMRSGFDSHDPEALTPFFLMLQDEGVDFIALHPRYARLSYKRKADWDLVKLAAETVTIPVIGNGDIAEPEECREKMDTYRCAGVMIGREAAKRPWFFALAEDRLRGVDREYSIDVEEIFVELLCGIRELLPERLHKSRGHRISFYYSKNVAFSHVLFTAIRKEGSVDGMIRVAREYFERNPGERKIEHHRPAGFGKAR